MSQVIKQLELATTKPKTISQLLKIVTDSNHQRGLHTVVACILVIFSKVDWSEWDMCEHAVYIIRFKDIVGALEYHSVWNINVRTNSPFFYLFLQAGLWLFAGLLVLNIILNILIVIYVKFHEWNQIHSTDSKGLFVVWLGSDALITLNFLKPAFKHLRIEGSMYLFSSSRDGSALV